MAGLLRETFATQCKGAIDPNCENFVNKVRLPAHKRFCTCGSPVLDLRKPNWLGVATVSISVLLVAGVSVFTVRHFLASKSWVSVHRLRPPTSGRQVFSSSQSLVPFGCAMTATLPQRWRRGSVLTKT